MYSVSKENEYSFIHLVTLVYFYSISSSPLLLIGAPDTAHILFLNFTPKRRRQLRVEDLLKVPTRQLEQNSTPRPFGRKATNLVMSHLAPRVHFSCTCTFYNVHVPGLTFLSCDLSSLILIQFS